MAVTVYAMLALAWPSIRCTAFTFAPDPIASDAAVCRNSCGTSLSSPAGRCPVEVRATEALDSQRRATRLGEHELIGHLAGELGN